MKITDWTRQVLAAVTAGRGQTKAWKRLVAVAVVSGSLACAGDPAEAQTSHVIQDPGFDEVDLTLSGVALGSGHYAYVRDVPFYPWVAAPGNDNSWLYNSEYSVGSGTVSAPQSADNAVHLADGNIYQIIGETFVSGRAYTLSAWVHYDLDQWVGDEFGLRLFDGSSGLFDGAEIVATQNYVLGSDYFDDGGWYQVSLAFTAGIGTDGKLIGIYLGPEAAANRLTVDDVTLTSQAASPGDFNGDGKVDAADYTVWRDGLGTKYVAEQYAEWKSNFGTGAGSGAGGLRDAAVPEPATCLLVGAAAAGVLGLRRHSTDSPLEARQRRLL
jgi:PEP-CTERM motif